jgi:hypothetical protein
MVIALRGPLQRNFERILAWCAVSGALALLALAVAALPEIALSACAAAVIAAVAAADRRPRPA